MAPKPFKKITIDGREYKQNPDTGLVSFNTTGKNRKGKILYLTPQAVKKRITAPGKAGYASDVSEYERSTVYKKRQEAKKKGLTYDIDTKTFKPLKATAKDTEQSVKRINDWTKKWINKNAKNYGVREFDKFKKALAKDWKKQLKIFEKNPKFRFPTTGKGVSLSTAEGLPYVRGLKVDKVSTPLKKDPTLGYEKIFYNKMLQRPDFKKKITEYLKFVNLDKRFGDVRDKMVAEGKLATGAGGKGFAPGGSKLAYLKYAKFLDDDVVYFMGDVLNSRKLWNNNPQAVNIYSILEENINPKLVKAYRQKLGGAYTSWMNNLRAVSKLAGYDFDKVLAAQYAEAAKMKKVFNVKNLPFEFQYAQDHLFGLAEAKELGDKKIAQQTLKNIVASTKEQNRYLGTKGFGQRRTKLMRDFVKAPVDARQPIIDDLNIISEEYVPGRLEYGLNKDGSLKITNLQPEKTFKSRAIGYGALIKDFPKAVQSLIAEGEAGGPICGLVRKAGAVGGSQQPGCGDEVRQALQEDPDKLIQEAANSKVKPGENTKFRTIARQILSKLPKGGKIGALVAGAGAVGLGTWAMTGDAGAEEPRTTDQSTMKYNSTTGEFVNTETGDPEDQQSKLDWIAENPVKSGLMGLPITIGLGYVAGGAKTMPGRYLTSWKAAIPAMMIPEKMWQYKQGMEAGEMITDPLNALWALGIENERSLKAAKDWYDKLDPDQRTRLMSMKTLKDLGTTQGWKNLPKALRTAILSPAAAGTDLAFQKRLKPLTKKLTESIIGSPGAKQVAKKGLGALAKRAAIGVGAAALLPATVAAGLVSAPLTLGLGALSFGYAQYKDYRDGKAIVDGMRAKGQISEEDAENYMSLIKQGSLPFGLGNRLFGDDEMTIRGQTFNPEQQRELLRGMEDQIDVFQHGDPAQGIEGRQQVRARDRADDFDFGDPGGWFSDGGRVGMKTGGMDRRGFLKWLAALGATVVGGATGLFKSGAKTGVKKGIEQVVKQAPKQFVGVDGMPAWFPRVVQKIKTHGKLVEMADKHYVNGDIYEMMIPVKVNRSLSGRPDHNEIVTVQKKVTLEENPVSGEIEISWSVDDFDGEMKRQMNFKPGESGFQKFGVDDPEGAAQGVTEYQRVKVSDAEFTYGNPDQSTPERADFEFKDIFEEGDEVVKGLEELTGNKKMVAKDGSIIDTVDEKGVDEAFQKRMFKDLEGEAGIVPEPESAGVSQQGDVYGEEQFNEIIGGEIPKHLQKKAGGGTVETGDIARRQSLVPPLAGPDPQGIMGLYSAPKQVRVG